MEWWQTIITLIGTLGGLELVKWLFNRKSNAKIVEAQADSAKIQAEEDEFHLKRERLKFADEQLLEQEKRYADLSDKYYEQTLLVRKLNEQAIEAICARAEGETRAELVDLIRSLYKGGA